MFYNTDITFVEHLQNIQLFAGWLSKHSLIPAEKNVINEPLVDRKKHHPSATAHQTRYHETVY